MTLNAFEKKLNTKKGKKHIKDELREYFLSFENYDIASEMLSLAYHYVIHYKYSNEEVINRINEILLIYNNSFDSKDYNLLNYINRILIYYDKIFDYDTIIDKVKKISDIPCFKDKSLDYAFYISSLYFSFILYDIDFQYLQSIIDYTMEYKNTFSKYDYDAPECYINNCKDDSLYRYKYKYTDITYNVAYPLQYLQYDNNKSNNQKIYNDRKSYLKFIVSPKSLFYQIIINKQFVTNNFDNRFLNSNKISSEIYESFFKNDVFVEPDCNIFLDDYYKYIYEEFKDLNAKNHTCVPLDNVDELFSNYGNSICLNKKPCIYFEFSGLYSEKSFGINVNYFSATLLELNLNSKLHYQIRGSGSFSKYNIYCYERRKFYSAFRSQTRQSRVHPTTLRDIINQCCDFDIIINIWNKWFDIEAKEYPFFKDVKKLFNFCIKYNIPAPPMLLSEIELYHDWNDYFNKKYKKSNLLNVNYNKINPIMSYYAIKSINKIKKEDIPLLTNYIQKNSDDTICYLKEYNPETNLVLFYYKNRLNLNFENCLPFPTETDDRTILLDYIRMSIVHKKPITLRKNSISKIEELHNELMISDYQKKTGPVSIPKKSVFLPLRKLLPEDEFEWIKTRKRLIQETVMQHHCVWSYSSSITDDISAIYSWVNPKNGNRHTIEFNYNKNCKHPYVINQIQKKYDKGYDMEIIERLKELNIIE